MAKSEAFARIKGDILDIVRAVPRGRVCTFGTVGRHLDVMARHVAYILATLTDDERAGLPWHRVVSDTGDTNRTKHGRGHEQRERLAAEGVALTSKGAVADLAVVLWTPE